MKQGPERRKKSSRRLRFQRNCFLKNRLLRKGNFLCILGIASATDILKRPLSRRLNGEVDTGTGSAQSGRFLERGVKDKDINDVNEKLPDVEDGQGFPVFP